MMKTLRCLPLFVVLTCVSACHPSLPQASTAGVQAVQASVHAAIQAERRLCQPTVVDLSAPMPTCASGAVITNQMHVAFDQAALKAEKDVIQATIDLDALPNGGALPTSVTDAQNDLIFTLNLAKGWGLSAALVATIENDVQTAITDFTTIVTQFGGK